MNSLPPEAVALFETSREPKTAAAWGLRYLWNRPEVSLVLSGMSNLNQIKENVETAKHGEVGNLTDTDAAILKRVQEILHEKIKVDCTGCKYCIPCPQGVDIPGCFEHYNNASLFSDEAGRRRAISNLWARRRRHRIVWSVEFASPIVRKELRSEEN